MQCYLFDILPAIAYYESPVGLTATTASPMVDYGRGHSFFLKMAMVAEF